jgi:bacterial/archaeal transporter family protein
MSYLWLVFALLSAVAASLVGIFGKIGLKGIDSNTATAVRAVIMAIFLFLVVVIQGKLPELPAILSNKKAFTFICLSGIAGASSWLFYFSALKLGKVSQVAPVDKLSVVFAILLAVLFLGEKISLVSGIGVVAITAGVILVAVG